MIKHCLWSTALIPQKKKWSEVFRNSIDIRQALNIGINMLTRFVECFFFVSFLNDHARLLHWSLEWKKKTHVVLDKTNGWNLWQPNQWLNQRCNPVKWVRIQSMCSVELVTKISTLLIGCISWLDPTFADDIRLITALQYPFTITLKRLGWWLFKSTCVCNRIPDEPGTVSQGSCRCSLRAPSGCDTVLSRQSPSGGSAH